MKYLLFLLLSAASFVAHAEDKNWGEITVLDTGLKVHGKYNSFERLDGAGTIIVRFSKGTTVTFNIVGISDKACADGYGDITFFDMGYRLVRKQDYVAKGGNGVAHIGDLLCALITRPKGTSL